MILSEVTEADADRGAHKPTVLVVDDDPTSRLLSGAALKDKMHVVEAENGQVAVETLDQRSFDIAVLDLDMPVMDGFGVIERARARPETRHLPIIVVTGREDVVAIERAFALGATSFLCKPINWNVFRHQVGYVLNVAQAERRLRAANKRLERVASLRGRCIAALGREIENTSSAIAQLRSEGSSALQAVREAGDRLSRLVARIDRTSDVLTGEAELSVQVVSAYDVAVAAVETIRATEGPDAAQRIETIASARPEVLCDPELAGAALVEVLKNALTASPPDARVKLRIVDAPPNRVRFEIEDSGKGIPEYMLESGIDDLAPEAVGPGAQSRTGLGLPLAKAIVDRHQGHFGIMSGPGRGTEVFLSFPAAEERAESQPALNRAAQIAS